MRIALKSGSIGFVLLLAVFAAKAAAGTLDMAAPRLNPIYLLNPLPMAQNKDAGNPPPHKPSPYLPVAINSFCQGKCAATFFVGRENETGQEHVLGIKRFVAPYDYQYGNSYFVCGALSRVIAEVGNLAALEIEVGVGQRFGDLHETEGWIALYGRWKYFPWNKYLITTVAVSTGLNYASDVSTEELLESGNGTGSRLLHYLSPEITFALPSRPDRELVIRNHHRSGGRAIYGNSVPLYGSIFHGTDGGTQYLEIGLRQHF